MNGSLSERSPGEILSAVQKAQASGILRLQQQQTVRQIFIDAGVTIRFAASSLQDESMTTLFRERAGLTEEQLLQATAAKEPQELLGTTLVRIGHLTGEALADLTKEHIRNIALKVLTQNEGTYEFQRGALPFREQMDYGVSTAEIILEWARNAPDLDSIRAHLAPLGTPVQKARRPPEGYRKVPLDSAEGYTMSRADGRTTVREICMLSPVGEERTLRALLGLFLSGLLETPPENAEAAGSQDQPRPIEADLLPSPRDQASEAPAALRPEESGPPAEFPPVPEATPPVSPGASEAGSAPAVPLTELKSEMVQRFDAIHTQDLYEVLGVPRSAGPEEVRAAYYGLAKKFHPDRFIREELKAKAEKVFGHITEAYSTLSQPETRQKYDEEIDLRSANRAPEKSVDPEELARFNFKRGKEHFQKGRFGEAVSFFQNACHQAPTKAEYFRYLALTQSKNPRWRKQAEENFLRAIDLAPSEAENYANLGSLYMRGGLRTKGREMFQKALQWDPSNQEALQGLAAGGDGKRGLLKIFSKR